ncbi:putative secreted protein (Por secretion system target) [Chryseobacterium sp. 52]|uniref:T9SS type A sorting domain-containing protein n=1 Tax=Chryseobacterium sp. 52 TaxID=2035213 RepID=UPI000C18739D|nr:T9SS type A sorting domain-containing protein [Chryseobacterium sp. 52]PIF43601.1 putative secreted protein (Por secretion system target) [Chryseobacterium sp. 52]
MKRILFSITALLLSSSAFSQYWSTQNTAFATASRGISGMEVYNASTIWAFAYNGSSSTANVQEFTKTSNGGTTWTSGSINIGNTALKITNISGVSATTAWVGAFDNTDGLGGIWKTTDGGATWINQHMLSTVGQSWTNYVHFFDANNGIVGGDPESGEFEIYTTSNGGTTWTRVPGTNIPDPLTDEYGYNGGYYAVGNNMFFYTGKGRIYKSTDKGLTWSVLATNSIISDFGGNTVNGDMAWSDSNTGIILRKTFSGTTPTGLQLHRTTDGGATWSAVTFTGITASNNIGDITYVPGTNILVATSSSSTNGGSWKSNNGTTWTSIDTGIQHLGVRCSDINTCYSGGFNTSSTVGGMFKSTQVLATSEVTNKTKQVSIYPNPTKGEINIKTDKKVKTVSVSDMSGRTVMKTDSGKTDLSSLPKGIYMIKAEFNDGTSATEKVIKQ